MPATDVQFGKNSIHVEEGHHCAHFEGRQQLGMQELPQHQPSLQCWQEVHEGNSVYRNTMSRAAEKNNHSGQIAAEISLSKGELWEVDCHCFNDFKLALNCVHCPQLCVGADTGS